MKTDPLYRELPDSFEPPATAAAAAPARRSRYSWGLALATFLWLGSAAAALWFVVPRFAEVYEQVKVPMPRVTLALIAASSGACQWPVLVGAAVLVASAWTGRWKGLPKALAKAFLPLALTVTIATLIVALFLPLIGSLEGIRPRPAGFRGGAAFGR